MIPVKIERTTNGAASPGDLIVYVDESPTKTRFGEDCGNVLAGNVAFGDPADGKYQMENFIAVRHFRTDAFCPFIDDNPMDCHHWLHTYYTYEEDESGSRCVDWPEYNKWQHRDGYYGGGIFFPASITDWYYEVAGIYTGGAAHLYYWYYVNQDWSTAAGPTLRDGNDLFGLNFNDVNPENPEQVPPHGLNPQYNPMVPYYGLSRPWPLNLFAGLAITNPAYSYVHYVNDIWSLDDLEAALAKFEIWYTHLRTRVDTDPEPKPKGNIDTDVVLTYPTKHDHFFFTDWPFMFASWWEGNCPVEDPTAGEFGHVVDTNAVRSFWANLLVYRGDGKPLFPELTFVPGLKDVEELIIWASEDFRIEEEKFIQPAYNQNGYTLAAWFQKTYLNGRIFVKSSLWDNEQNPPVPPPEDEPPGSPWFPDPPPDRWAPHEVNIVRVGESSPAWVNATPPGTINDLNWLLALAQYPYHKGHFVIAQSYLAGQRQLWNYEVPLHFAFEAVTQHEIYNDSSYLIPPIGLVILNQNFGSVQIGVNRSAMAEWHYLVEWGLLNDRCKERANDCPDLPCCVGGASAK
jgi:hypothetical protein